jgi:hypothetical protein
MLIRYFCRNRYRISMSSNSLFDNIHKRFIAYESFLSTSNKLGLGNESAFAENHMSELLKHVFGWKTVNGNEDKMNQEGYDLVDRKKKIFVQITANRSYSTKVKMTVKTFKKQQTENPGYSFYIVFISSKVPHTLLGRKTDEDLNYTVYSIPELLSKIKYMSPSKMSKIEHVLDEITRPLDLGSGRKKKKIYIVPFQDPVERKAGLYVKRDKLIEDLFDFSQLESGLLTGGPGYGKSIVMEELQRKYKNLDIPCFIVRINELGTGDEEEIDRQLSCRKWLDSLKNMKWDAEEKGLLMFDAFDTAKSDTLKVLMLQRIRDAKNLLEPRWHILAGARVYDAEYSSTLQELFPQVSHSKAITCRNFYIPDLTIEERDEALESADLTAAARQCGTDLMQLLKIPYFLKLFEDIFSSDSEAVSGAVESEEDLLFVFWKKKVESEMSYPPFLDRITRAVIQSEGLVCDKLGFSGSEDAAIFRSLASLHVLCEVSMGREIGYFHNILAEYAVCRYILEVKIDRQLQLISESPSLVFHFRQSFIYFYDRMWRTENQMFWQHYNKIKSEEQPVFKLLYHTILNYILVNSYKESAEILAHINKDEEYYGFTVQKTLQSLRLNRKGVYETHDGDFILEVCESIEVIFLMELGRSIELLIEWSQRDNDATASTAGKAAMAYMEFVLRERESADGPFIEHCGAVQGLPNVVKSYNQNPAAARMIIDQTLGLLNTEGFNINYFYYLADMLPTLATKDLEYSLSVFRTLYYHRENSTEKTNMGGSAIINLSSNRRQDYDMVRHALDTRFSELLDLDFDLFAGLGLDIANKYCSAERRPWQVNPSKISIGDFQTVIRYDERNYGDTKEYGPSSFVWKIFGRLEKRFDNAEDYQEIESSLHVILRKGGASLIWRELLQFLTRSQKFLNTALQILRSKGIYECEETLHEAGELLKIIWPSLSAEDRKEIEQNVHNLTPVDGIHEKLNVLRVLRILGCVPQEELVLEKSKKVLSQHSRVENTPIVQQTSLRIAEPYTHTREEKMIYAGFDPETDLEEPVYLLYELLEQYNSLYENNSRPEELKKESKKVLQTAERLFQYSLSYGYRNEEIKESCDAAVSRCVRIIAGQEIDFTAPEHEKLKEMALFYVQAEAYCLPEYQPGTIGRRYFKGTEIRGESLKALLYLFETVRSLKLLAVFEALTSDNHPDIRYKALQSLHIIFAMDKNAYWRIVVGRTAAETDGLCLSEIAGTFKWIDVLEDNLDQSVELSIRLLHKLASGEKTGREIYNETAVVALTIARYFGYQNGMEIIGKGLKIKDFCRNIVFIIRTTINSYEKEQNFEELLEKGKVFFDILHFLQDHYFGELVRKGLGSLEIKEDLEMIDNIISNLYFAFTYHDINSDNKKLERRMLYEHKKRALYSRIIPLCESAAAESLQIEHGFMASHTGYYFMMLLNKMLHYEPERILRLSASVIRSASKNNFTYDQTAFREIIRLTEKILADHKQILRSRENLNHLLEILELFTASGFDQAVELTLKLKEVF